MHEKIREMLSAQKICEIYLDTENLNKFSVGYIMASDDTYFMAGSIDQYGNNDGLFCSIIDNIVKFQTSTSYLKNIIKLYKYKKQKRYGDSLNASDSNILLKMLKFVMGNKKICTIELCDSKLDDVIGFVESVDASNNLIEVQIVDCNGKEDGKAVVDLEMISYLTCDSLDDQKVEILFNLEHSE